MFGRHVGRNLRPYGYKRPFRHVRGYLSRADLVVGNLETPITKKRYFWMHRSVLVFRAKPKAARILKRAGFNLMITANNHSRDQKDKGMMETMEHLKAAGLHWVGTGKSRKAAFAPYIYEKKGVKVGFLAYTLIRNYRRRQRRAFFAYVDKKKGFGGGFRRIKKLRKRVDFVVVSMHYGDEYRRTPTYRERRLMRRMVKAGADVILGHHPHVLRGIQRIGGALVFYSLGNFMFDMTWKGTDESAVTTVLLEKKGEVRRVVGAWLRPVRIQIDGLPHRTGAAKGRTILKNIVSASRRFRRKTRLRIGKRALHVSMPRLEAKKPTSPKSRHPSR